MIFDDCSVHGLSTSFLFPHYPTTTETLLSEFTVKNNYAEEEM